MVSQFEIPQVSTHQIVEGGELEPLTCQLGPQLGALQFTNERDLIESAQEKAKRVREIIDKQGWSVQLRGKAYVKAEGWCCLAAMVGLVPTIIGTSELENGARAAVAELRDCTSKAYVRADAECGDELDGRWAREPGYSKRSMAQTRAISKCCRASLSWVMTLAGYQATPYEEVQGRDFAEDNGASTNLKICILAMRENALAIDTISKGFLNRDNHEFLSDAAVAWFELDADTKRALWIAPSKGGPFSTEERTILKSAEFRQLAYPDS